MQSTETSLHRNRFKGNGQPIRPPVLPVTPIAKPPAAAQPANTRAAESTPHGSRSEPDQRLFAKAKAAGNDIEAVMQSGRIHRGQVLSWGLYSVELQTDGLPLVVLKVAAESFQEVP